jgi:hypothetical protein
MADLGCFFGKNGLGPLEVKMQGRFEFSGEKVF